MSWQQTPYTIPLLLSAAGSVGLAAYVVIYRSRHSSTVTLPFVAATLAGATWSAGYGLQLASTELSAKVIWSQAVWIGSISIPTIWFVFVLGYTNRDRWFTKHRLALFAVEPIVMLGAVWTSGFHGLFVRNTTVTTGEPFRQAVTTFGPLFWVHLGYGYLLTLLSSVLLVEMVVQSKGLYRRQAAMILLAGTLPWLGTALHLAGIVRFSVDPTPLSFAFTNLLIAWALLHDRLFNIVPVARNRVIEELQDGIVVLDSRNRILDLNPAAREILGDEQTSILGSRVDRVVPEFGPLAASSGRNELHEVHIDRNGVRRVLDVHVSPISDPLDSHTDYTLVLRDVTERHDMERQFRTLIEGSSDLISVVDRDGTRQYLSPSVEPVLGYDPDELIGQQAFSLVHPDDIDAVRETFERLVDGEREARVECRVRHRDGSWRTFESIGTNFFDDSVIDGVLVTSRDVTQRRGYEQRLRVLNRVLRHDLRNDVTVILGNVDLLKSELSTSDALSRARTIEEKSRELVELSEKARQIDYTVHHMGNTKKSVNVVETLRRHLDTVRAEHPAVVVDADLPEDEFVYADDLLGSAIDNVLENAIEHNDRSRPEIRVSASPVSVGGIDYVDVRVADNGPGIHEEERRILTERTETPLHHASGLGLWLVNWIVDNSDGDLLFGENEPRGSVVTIRLRRSEPTEK